MGLERDSSYVITTEIKTRVPDKTEDHLVQNQLIYLNKMYPLWCLSRYKFHYSIAVALNTNTAPIMGCVTLLWTSQESRQTVLVDASPRDRLKSSELLKFTPHM